MTDRTELNEQRRQYVRMVEVRVASFDDNSLAHWLDVHNSVRPNQRLSAANMKDWRRQSQDLTCLVAGVDGVDVACGLGIMGWHRPPGVGIVEVEVLDDYRRRGIGRTVLESLREWAQSLGAPEIDSTVEIGDSPSLGWASRRGFHEVQRYERLALELSGITIPELDAPHGVEIVTWAERPDLAEGMYAVYCEAGSDVPGEEDVDVEPYPQWLDHDMQGSGDLPEATFVALARGAVVGYAKLSLTDASPETAFHDLTAVARMWRGRGVASALKRAEIAWAHRQGYQRLETSPEVSNEPSRRLNARFGYLPCGGSVTLRGLANPPP